MRLKVISVSQNHNAFGLRGMIMISDNGQAWEAAANDLNVKQKGDIITTTVLGSGEPSFTGLGLEIPRRLSPDPTPAIMKEIWGEIPKKPQTLQDKLACPKGLCTCIVFNDAENAARIKFILDAFLAGTVLQSASRNGDDWELVSGLPSDFVNYRYRIAQ